MIWMLLSDADRREIARLFGRRVLIVEDDFLVGLTLKQYLKRLGCEVVGPIATVAKALRFIEDEPLDAAVLDINISGGASVPVAERLQQLRKPFIFVSGYASPSHLLPDPLREVELLSKPVDERTLSRALEDVLN